MTKRQYAALVVAVAAGLEELIRLQALPPEYLGLLAALVVAIKAYIRPPVDKLPE